MGYGWYCFDKEIEWSMHDFSTNVCTRFSLKLYKHSFNKMQWTQVSLLTGHNEKSST